MTEAQTVHLAKTKHENVADVLVGLVSVAMLYYALNPGALDDHREMIHNLWSGVLHRVSIWQAHQSIRSLPETREKM